MRAALAVFAFLLAAPLLRADVVVLVNGDRVTGRVIGTITRRVRVQTPYGTLVIPADKVVLALGHATPSAPARLPAEVRSHPGYVAFYLVAISVIFFHLWHGLSSAAQSLGLDHPNWTPRILVLGRLLTVVIAGGFFVLPIATFLISRGAR